MHQLIRATASAWAGVAVQHPGGQVAAERRAGEPEVPLQPVDHDATSPSVSAPSVSASSVSGPSVSAPSVSRSSCPGSSCSR